MSSGALRYAVVTPARNESVNLRRLAQSLAEQEALPTAWLIVDTGSTDDTRLVVTALEAAHPWTRGIALAGESRLLRGGPIARGFEAGFAALREPVDVVVKVDADVSFPPDYFARLLDRFAADPTLGMASGTCLEQEDGEWRPRYVTGSTVWGAARAYRTACLEQVLPLEQRMGWDGVDEFRANVRGWQTIAYHDLTFRHHRREGERDGSRRRARMAQGRAARYIGYRFWYLALRALWHARKEPAALAMISGYLRAALSREEPCADREARAYLRRQQSLLRLPRRLREARGAR